MLWDYGQPMVDVLEVFAADAERIVTAYAEQIANVIMELILVDQADERST